MAKPVKIMETVLRDGHQSLCATRMHLSDMLPQLAALDQVGYKALEALALYWDRTESICACMTAFSTFRSVIWSLISEVVAA